MSEKRAAPPAPQWMAYATAATAIAYALYKYIRYDRTTPEQLKEEGTTHYINKRYTDALKKYQQAVQASTTDSTPPNTVLLTQLYNNISQTYYAMEQYEQSTNYAQLTLQLTPTHSNSIKRLAKIEGKGKGYGGVRGLAVIMRSVEECTSDSTSDALLTQTIDQLVQLKCNQLQPIKELQVSLIKLQDALTVFKDALRDPSFGHATPSDEYLLSCIDNHRYNKVLDYVGQYTSTPHTPSTPRTLFILGTIKYIQKCYPQAIEYLTQTNNIYGDVLVMYIQKKSNSKIELSQTKLSAILNKKSDPIIKIYLAQLHLLSNSTGQYLASMLELENELNLALPFISNAKSQLSLKEYKEALETIRKGLLYFPNDLEMIGTAIEVLAQVDGGLGKEKEEILRLVKRLEVMDRSPRGSLFKYIGYAAVNDEEKSVLALDEALEEDPFSDTLCVQKGELLIGKDDKRGLEWLDRAARLAPDKAKEIYRVMVVYEGAFRVREEEYGRSRE